VNSTVKTIVFWVFILACCILLWQVFQRSSNTGKEQEISFSQFLNDAQQGQIHDVTVVGGEVHGHFRSANAAFHVEVPTNYPQLYDILNKNHVAVTVKDNSGSPWWSILIQFSPVLVLVALWFFMIRQMQSGLRQEPRAPALHAAEKSHFQRCGRRR